MRNKKGRGEDRVDPELENEDWKLLRTWGIPICYGCNLNLSLSFLAATAKTEHFIPGGHLGSKVPSGL